MPNILPVFIPFHGCKNRCIYCNQTAITAIEGADIIASAREQFNRWSSSATQWTEAAFYGGTFGNLPATVRKALYDMAGDLGIRFSTCPDTITEELIDEIKEYNVTTVELGVQSLSESVLIKNGRNYTVEAVLEAFRKLNSLKNRAEVIDPRDLKSRKPDLKICAQLMVGMYGESREDLCLTASALPNLKADLVRIYPTLVLKDTLLERYYKEEQFTPITPCEVLLRSAWLYIHAETEHSKVIRVGLPHDVNDNNTITAGWWHPALGDLVRTLVLNAYINCFGRDALPESPNFNGYKGLIKKMHNGEDRDSNKTLLRVDSAPVTMKTVTAGLREYYSESEQWFIEGANIDFAQILSSEANL